jgi:SAM-dependent methyltransferase
MKTNNYYEQEAYEEYLYTGFLGFLFKYQHKKLTPDSLINKEKILEIGPGFEPHIKYRKLNFKEYYCVEINNSIKLKNYYNEHFPNIVLKIYDGSNLNFPDNTFDRIIISHTLEHIPMFEKFIDEMLRVLKKGSVISIASPCDNGLFWRLGRFFLKKFYHKNKSVSEIEYDYLMAKEHVNTIFQIMAVLKKKYVIKEELFLPFRFKFIDFNLIHLCHIIKK